MTRSGVVTVGPPYICAFCAPRVVTGDKHSRLRAFVGRNPALVNLLFQEINKSWRPCACKMRPPNPQAKGGILHLMSRRDRHYLYYWASGSRSCKKFLKKSRFAAMQRCVWRIRLQTGHTFLPANLLCCNNTAVILSAFSWTPALSGD